MNNRDDVASQTRLRRLCILGASLDVDNRGVHALAVSTLGLVQATYSPLEVSLLYGSSNGEDRVVRVNEEDSVNVRVVNCRLSPKSRAGEHILVILLLAMLYRMGMRGPARRNKWLSQLLQADLVGDIRGGDSFSDIYGFRRFLLGSLPLLSVIALGKDYVMLPQTYGPFKTNVSKLMAAAMLKRAKVILVRDENCRATVSDLCGRTTQFCPDVAFTLSPIKPKRVDLAPECLTIESANGLIGLNVSGLLYMGGYDGRNMFGLRSDYRRLIERLAQRLLAEVPQASIMIVPHVFGSEQEQEASDTILSLLNNGFGRRVFALRSPLSSNELKWVIGKTEFFIGSRMHACIAALSQGIPTVGLAYSAKFLGVFQSVGMGDSVVDLRTRSDEEVVGLTIERVHERRETAERLRPRVATIQDQVRAAFRSLRRAVA